MRTAIRTSRFPSLLIRQIVQMFLFLVVFSEKDPGIEIAQGNIIFVLTFRINEASSFLSFRFFKLRKFLCIIEVLITVASFRIDETENKRVTKRTNRDEASRLS